MDIDIISIVFGGGGKAAEFFSSSFFVLALKFFLFVYVMVLLVDIVLLLVLRGLSSDFKKVLFGSDRPLMARSTVIKRWEKILARLEQDNPSQYKVALLEADALADEILSGIGFKGTTMAEKLENIKGGQLETKEGLIEAHAIRNRVVHETDFVLSREEAEKCLDTYKRFFDEVELF
jgi:hypothetical protein